MTILYNFMFPVDRMTHLLLSKTCREQNKQSLQERHQEKSSKKANIDTKIDEGSLVCFIVSNIFFF